jgi:hypothetical protein
MTTPIAPSGITSDPPGIVTTNYFGYEGGYSLADSIRPGFGYWVKTTSNGTLMFTSTALAKPKSSTTSTDIQLLNRISISDSEGNHQTLYFGFDEAKLTPEKWEMPPASPRGSFDARFATNRIVELFDATEERQIPIIVSSDHYPVRIEWSEKDSDSRTTLVVDNTAIAMNGRGAIEVADRTSHISLNSTAHHSTTATPRAYVLQQNYPNPFNALTKISYSVPVDGSVTLEIVDVLGRRMETLLDETKMAGAHTVDWNAANYPTGVYFYRMKAGVFVETKKLFLMK